MADSGNEQGATGWPRPNFPFVVTWQNRTAAFQAVSGLGVETDPMQFHSANSNAVPTVAVQGMHLGCVTLQRGVLPLDSSSIAWIGEIGMNTAASETVSITMLDGAGKALLAWTLTNAWPTKIDWIDPTRESNEVTVDLLEIRYRGLRIENP